MKTRPERKKHRRPILAGPLFNPYALRKAMVNQEVTYTQLHKELGPNPATLRQVVLGKDCKVSTLVSFARRLGVRVSDLFPD